MEDINRTSVLNTIYQNRRIFIIRNNYDLICLWELLPPFQTIFFRMDIVTFSKKTSAKTIFSLGIINIVSSTANFKESYTDMQPIFDKMRRKVDAIKGLPEGIDGPNVDDEYGDVFGSVYALTAEGFSSREIGQKLFISPKTVDTYRSRIMDKLGLSHRSELVRFALRVGLLKEV